MRHGLTKTLAAVAVVLLCAQTFASVPVVQEIPSPVITDDDQPITGSYLFVYKDWLSPKTLDDYVSDDGPDSAIVWSFTADNGRYGMNGAQRLTGTDDKVNPPAAKIINSAANVAASGESNTDVRTPTVRDITLTPYGAVAGTNPLVAGGTVIATAQVTMWASDGTTAGFSPRPITFYTQEWDGTPAGGDRLSATPVPTPVRTTTLDFTTGSNGWHTDAAIGAATYQSAGGLCITTAATGGNIGEWISPYNIINLTDNSVWRVRLHMTTTQATAGAVPMWDVYVQNLDTDAVGNVTAGDLAYIGDFLFIDQSGSANAVKGPATGLNDFELWYTPACEVTPQWRNGVFAPAYDGKRDLRMVFRILDVDGSYGGAATAAGQVCLQTMSVDKFDLSEIDTTTNVYTLNPIVSGASGVSAFDTVANIIGPGGGAGSVEDFNNNPMTVTPFDAAGWLTELTTITPGDTTNPDISSPSYDPAQIPDNYPVVWESNTLYRITVDASAPNDTGETNGPDGLLLSYDSKTTELLGDSYVLTGLDRLGSPKTVAHAGAPQSYVSFFWSHNTTASPVVNANRLRPKIEIVNSNTYNRPTSTDLRNLGGIRIHDIKVDKVTFFGQ